MSNGLPARRGWRTPRLGGFVKIHSLVLPHPVLRAARTRQADPGDPTLAWMRDLRNWLLSGGSPIRRVQNHEG